jgi:hypothetical protein
MTWFETGIGSTVCAGFDAVCITWDVAMTWLETGIEATVCVDFDTVPITGVDDAA